MARRSMKSLAGAGLLALLAGCASTSVPPRPVVTQARPHADHPLVTSADPLLGRTASSLITLFGQPALDVREGPGRKLQFSGADCVLDLYIYPPQRGGEPISTHADARLPDGRDTDRAACAAALRRR